MGVDNINKFNANEVFSMDSPYAARPKPHALLTAPSSPNLVVVAKES
jgi:hypothetical protein